MRLNNKRPNDRVAVALVLCFCVVAIASIFTMRSNLEQLDLDNNDNINIAQDKQGERGGLDVVQPVPTVDSTVPKQDIQKPDAQKQDVQKQDAASNFTAPLKGTVTKGFSKDVPVYSKTLDQFIIHNGVDIEAPADTQVASVADGTVTKVFTDDKLGITIEISHGGGLITKYSNLSTTKMVGEGDVVKKGQVISGVGNTALFESLEAPHLHFEVWKDGAPVDPSEFAN